jgi:excisionase family DNA binding protein
VTATAPAPTPAVAPITLDARGAAQLVGCSRSTWLQLASAGRTPAGVKLGRLRRWSTSELSDWIAAGAPPRSRWEAMRTGGKR